MRMNHKRYTSLSDLARSLFLYIFLINYVCFIALSAFIYKCVFMPAQVYPLPNVYITGLMYKECGLGRSVPGVPIFAPETFKRQYCFWQAFLLPQQPIHNKPNKNIVFIFCLVDWVWVVMVTGVPPNDVTSLWMFPMIIYTVLLGHSGCHLMCNFFTPAPLPCGD